MNNFDIMSLLISAITPVALAFNFVLNSSIKQQISDLKMILYRDFVTWKALHNDRTNREKEQTENERVNNYSD